MKRVGLKQEFNGEPDPTEEGIAAENNGKDEVVLEVVSGQVSFIVPTQVPDDRVVQKSLMERYLNCVLILENGAELALWINEGACGVDVRLSPPQPKIREFAQRSKQLA